MNSLGAITVVLGALLTVAHRGSGENSDSLIQQTCICPKLLSPVCGSDGQTYVNPCLLRCSQNRNPGLKEDCKGGCPCLRVRSAQLDDDDADIRCLTACPREIGFPICASNGITYRFRCHFRCAQRSNPGTAYLRIVHIGECTTGDELDKGF